MDPTPPSEAARQHKLAQEREKQSQRDMFIEKALVAAAKERPGVEHSVFWARQGQYGKDAFVLCTDGKGQLSWVDPCTLPKNCSTKLCIRTDEASMMAACLSAKKDASYCVFRRHYVPRWSITDSEVLTVYQKLG